ncbi:hypothetical protein HDU86_003429 [Geranomyces michiganensis]|nr:hypothetical protein HDU86_003429 [Geranomyces michiganensis]
MPPYATTMTEYHHHSATDIWATRPLNTSCDATVGPDRGRHQTGDIDVIRYTMSSLQLDETHWSNSSPPHGGLAGMGHRAAPPKQKHPQTGMRHVSADATLKCAADGGAPPQRPAYAAAAAAAMTAGAVAAKTAQHQCRAPSSLSSASAPEATENKQLVKAATVLQRAFRAKKQLETERKAAAAVKIQATFRSYKSRSEKLGLLQSHNNMLLHEIASRDNRLARSSAELHLHSGMIEQFGKTVNSLRRQLSEMQSSYEMKLEVKEKQIEQLDRDLQIALRTTSDLKYRLESNAVEYAKMAWEFKEKDSDSVHQYTMNLQREVESIRCQLSEMRSTREADGIRLSLKDKEIHELRYQMKEVRRNLESELANKNGENDELRIRLSRLQIQGQMGGGGGGSAPGGAGSIDGELPPRAPSSVSAHGAPAVKSIWGSGDNNVSSFALFSHEQNASDAMYSNGSSKSSTPAHDHGSLPHSAAAMSGSEVSAAKGIWNPITCDLDFLNMSPAMVPMSAESLVDLYGQEAGLLRDCDDYGYGRNSLASRLLPPAQEKNTAANFYFLVDKIVRTNDQPASLLLQQKLKTGTSDVKGMIFDAILGQAIALIKNRFGNFLMQRVLEFGSPQQVRILGQTMRGNVLNLACDRFGCHVIQKALETVDEDLRTSLITELFRCVRETITHRFACHVWQRIFQIKWNGEPPAVMHYLDASLKGQWHLIANDENGSLVVQCIFENCSQKEKGPILCEVLARTVEVARGQWGNWVIQHILEHGAPVDRNYVMKVLVHNFYPMAVDQYASKVVEKGLKLAPKREMYEMIETVLSSNPRDIGRPWILEMMNNQFANYVVQHILNLADPLQKDLCIRLLLPHISTLRNSKYGQRVAAIVEKHLRNGGGGAAGSSNSSGNGGGGTGVKYTSSISPSLIPSQIMPPLGMPSMQQAHPLGLRG